MRIGIFSDAYLPIINGVVTSVVTLKKGLEERGHEVFIVSNHPKMFELEYKDNILLLPGFTIKFLFDNNLSNPLQLRAIEIIKRMNLDIIHVQTEFGIGLLARYVSKKENIPLVYTYHTTYEDYTHYINPIHSKQVEKMARKLVATLSRQLSKPANAIITPSSKTKELLENYGVYQPIHVIPTGVNLERFKESDEIKSKALEIRQKYKVSDNETLFVFVGRLGEEKNLEMIIKGIKENPVKLMIVGGGPIYDDLENLIKKLNVEEKVFLTNRVPNDQIASYYHAGDVFISASLTETQGLTFIEAMACGCPLFASDKEVLLDLLEEEVNGYFFDDLDELNIKLRKYLNLTQEEKNMMSKESLRMVEPYSDVVFVDSIVNLYQKVLSQSDNHDYSVSWVKRGQNYSLIEFSNDLNNFRMILSNQEVDEKVIVEDRLVSEKELSQMKNNDEIQKKVSKCLAKLTYHDYSEAQLRDYLNQEDPEHPVLNEEVIKVLIDKGFVDDERFINELVTRYQEKGYGLYRISNNLDKYKFDEALVAIVLDELSDQQHNDLINQYHKIITQNYKGSKLSVKNKIYEKLVRQGFKASIVSDLMNKEDFEYDELSWAHLDYQKLLKKKIDNPSELRNKLSAKGYSYETIQQVLKGEEE